MYLPADPRAPAKRTAPSTGSLIRVLFGVAFFVGLAASASAQVVVTFPDPNMDAVIRDAIGIPAGPIYDTDLQGLTYLDGGGAGISDITGIEYCTDLVELYLDRNQISNSRSWIPMALSPSRTDSTRAMMSWIPFSSFNAGITTESVGLGSTGINLGSAMPPVKIGLPT